ncbi:hypothetical protein MA4S0726RB_3608 [Mycobacteroides abscessus 4S-0726-RB]|nr:hypothetical protein MA4S0726RB_3608 [Mycobacteroides abscessus 4S-0726-RB]EIV07293.1 hypothetical protein MA4S0206_4094 [Mycobacteroides abscessus 4S-0206]EIV48071.1 hypothetical protein MA4S0116R_4052 [Mycobacteroides abscessus 4S-0116-R]EIV60255.1 hypothetical protein MA4S0116S_3156 [Mycobacteroides abscessus 4S-0116-S]
MRRLGFQDSVDSARKVVKLLDDISNLAGLNFDISHFGHSHHSSD